MPAPRTAPHPLRVAIIAAGWPSVASFCRHIGVEPSGVSAVMTGRLAAWPKLRRSCAEELGVPEAELFPGDRVFRPTPVP
jgi:hypothetical protein